MKKSYLKILSLSDIVIIMIDNKSDLNNLDKSIISAAEECKKKIILILNKIDLIPEEDVLKKISNLNTEYQYPIYPLSVESKQGINDLYEFLHKHATDVTDSDNGVSQELDKLTIQEIIRGVINNATYNEVAYDCAVVTDKIINNKKIFKISNTIYVNKINHKKIIIGKGGSNIKNIGIEARTHLEKLIDKQVHIDLFVKIKNNWKNDYDFLRELGYML